MIRLTVKGLAKFMTKGPAAQRTVLRNFKFPNPEGKVQTVYYAEARQAIREYHTNGNQPAFPVRAVDDLRQRAVRAEGQARIRLEHNIRAIESYLRHFAGKQFLVLQTPKLEYLHGNVHVSAVPDLCVQEKGRLKIIKLELGTDAPDRQAIKIILQVIYEAARAAGNPVRPQDVVYLDASRATQHKGAKIRARLKRDIEAACQIIEALWPGI